MRLIQFPNIGWVIVPERNIISDVILQYTLLDSEDEFKKLYNGLIVEDIDEKPDIVKANNICLTNHRVLIYYTGIQSAYSNIILSQYNLKIMMSGDEFMKIMNQSISLFETFDDYSDDMSSWNLDKWIEYSGADRILIDIPEGILKS